MTGEDRGNPFSLTRNIAAHICRAADSPQNYPLIRLSLCPPLGGSIARWIQKPRPKRHDHQRPLILEITQLLPPRPLGPPSPSVFHCSSFRSKPKSTSRWPRNNPSVHQQKNKRWSIYIQWSITWPKEEGNSDTSYKTGESEGHYAQ